MIEPSMFWAVVALAVISLIGALTEHERFRRARRDLNELTRQLSLVEIERDDAVRLMRRALRKES